MESRILIGDCKATLATLPAGSVQMCVTSPPYFALRSYLPKDHPDKALEIGSEPTIEAFIATMLEVFEAVRRVLRDDGTLWVNIGDSYDAGTSSGRKPSADVQHGYWQNGGGMGDRRVTSAATKTGDQMLVPYIFAKAMRDAGWYLRSTIIWRKLSPMPESIAGVRWQKCRVKISSQGKAADAGLYAAGSGNRMCRPGSGGVTGVMPEEFQTKWQPCPGCAKCLPNNGYVLRRGRWRPTQAHEPIFLFSKSERYFCDGDAVAEAAHTAGRLNLGFQPHRAIAAGRLPSGNELGNGAKTVRGETRNPRSVMTFPAEPYKLAHFATYPSSLPAFCIRAGTSSAGCCPKCGACYAPVVESERVPTRPGETNQIDESGMANRDPQRHVAVNRVTGYRPTCNCAKELARQRYPNRDMTGREWLALIDELAAEMKPVPCTVLDPFLGSGTTLQAAKALGRSGIGCELNAEYVAMAEERIDTPPKWATTKPKRKRLIVHPSQLDLFAQ